MRKWIIRLLGGVSRDDYERAMAERDMNVAARSHAYIRVLGNDGGWIQSSHVPNRPLPDGRDCYPIRVRRLS